MRDSLSQSVNLSKGSAQVVARSTGTDTIAGMLRSAPATRRNRGPILAVLQRVLPPSGTVLEVASGTGEHAVFFGRHLPDLVWQPSDPAAELRATVAARVEEAGLPNVRPPVDLDTRRDSWPVREADAVVCINMIHIAPWKAAVGLFRGAARILPPGAPLYLYGPYVVRDRPTAPSNEAFDASLREQNPEWGLRNLDDVVAVGESHGFRFMETVDMPANNLSVILSAGGGEVSRSEGS